MSEASFTSTVVDLFRAHGWRAVHFRPARTAKGWRTAFEGDAGFPDFVAAKDGDLEVQEHKLPGNHPTSDQRLWLAASGGRLVSPRDWDLIVQVAQGRIPPTNPRIRT